MKKLIFTLFCVLGLFTYAEDASVSDLIRAGHKTSVTNRINSANAMDCYTAAVESTNVWVRNYLVFNTKLIPYDVDYQRSVSQNKYIRMITLGYTASNDTWSVAGWRKFIDTDPMTNFVSVQASTTYLKYVRLNHLDMYREMAVKAKRIDSPFAAWIIFNNPKLFEGRTDFINVARDYVSNTRNFGNGLLDKMIFSKLYLGTKNFDSFYDRDYFLHNRELTRPNTFEYQLLRTAYKLKCNWIDEAISTMTSVDYSDNHLASTLKWLDRYSDGRYTKKYYSKLLRNYYLSLSAAIRLNDADKVIDRLSEVGMDITPVQFEGIIKVLNALDANYRKDEVRTILANINSKYTIKLYDDRSTWEPIISKIRAMMDVR